MACAVTLIGGRIELVWEPGLPTCEITKLDEYNAIWTFGAVTVHNKTASQVTVRLARVPRENTTQIVPNTERLIQVPPRGSVEIAFFRAPPEGELCLLSVVQVTTESKTYTLTWAVISAAVTGIGVALIMAALQRTKEKAAQMREKVAPAG